MPRVVSVYFPYLPTDRIRRHGGHEVPADQPLVVISKSGSRRWISASDANALKLGSADRHAREQGSGDGHQPRNGRCQSS